MRFLIALLLLFSAGLQAETQDDIFGEVDKDRYQELIGELRCLVCQNQSLAESDADLAKDMRNEVKRQMATGASDEQIVDHLVARYGDFVRYRPPFTGTTLLLWLGPLLLLAIGAVFLIRRGRSQETTATLSAEDRARAESLLQTTDKDNSE